MPEYRGDEVPSNEPFVNPTSPSELRQRQRRSNRGDEVSSNEPVLNPTPPPELRQRQRRSSIGPVERLILTCGLLVVSLILFYAMLDVGTKVSTPAVKHSSSPPALEAGSPGLQTPAQPTAPVEKTFSRALSAAEGTSPVQSEPESEGQRVQASAATGGEKTRRQASSQVGQGAIYGDDREEDTSGPPTTKERRLRHSTRTSLELHEDKTPRPRATIYTQWRRVAEFESRQSWAEAAKLLAEMKMQHPGDGKIRQRYGICLVRMGHYAPGINELQMSTRMGQDNALTRHYLNYAYEKSGMGRGALRASQRAGGAISQHSRHSPRGGRIVP